MAELSLVAVVAVLALVVAVAELALVAVVAQLSLVAALAELSLVAAMAELALFAAVDRTLTWTEHSNGQNTQIIITNNFYIQNTSTGLELFWDDFPK